MRMKTKWPTLNASEYEKYSVISSLRCGGYSTENGWVKIHYLVDDLSLRKEIGGSKRVFSISVIITETNQASRVTLTLGFKSLKVCFAFFHCHRVSD